MELAPSKCLREAMRLAWEKVNPFFHVFDLQVRALKHVSLRPPKKLIKFFRPQLSPASGPEKPDGGWRNQPSIQSKHLLVKKKLCGDPNSGSPGIMVALANEPAAPRARVVQNLSAKS